jgi:hypothetical protein
VKAQVPDLGFRPCTGVLPVQVGFSQVFNRLGGARGFR